MRQSFQERGGAREGALEGSKRAISENSVEGSPKATESLDGRQVELASCAAPWRDTRQASQIASDFGEA